jgi:hypothetical protein
LKNCPDGNFARSPEVADGFLFLGVHRSHRLSARLIGVYLRVDVLELGIAILVIAAFAGLEVGLKAV